MVIFNLLIFTLSLITIYPAEKALIEKYSGEQQVSRPYVIGHRGMMLMAPENTLSAYRSCVEKGIGIEIDVRTSKDNKLVIMHNDSFKRTTDGPDVSVRQLTLAEIKKLDAGSWFSPQFKGERVPTLDETLKLVSEMQKGKVPIAVNIKDIDENGEKQLVALLKKYNLTDQSFCFDQSRACSERLKALDMHIRIAQNVVKGNLSQELKENFLDVFLIWFIPTQEEVAQLKHAGKSIVLNMGGPRAHEDDPAYFRLFLTAGIDAILIDHALEFNDYINTLSWK